jgi:hypothetical protein
MDKYRVIRAPLTSESAMKKIEEHNTLVFLVDVNANKHQIRAAVKSLYEIDTLKINTLIRLVFLLNYALRLVLTSLFPFLYSQARWPEEGLLPSDQRLRCS